MLVLITFTYIALTGVYLTKQSVSAPRVLNNISLTFKPTYRRVSKEALSNGTQPGKLLQFKPKRTIK